MEFNLRTSPNLATGMTPAIALYGRDLKKGVLEIPETEETALDERPYNEKRKAAVKAMKAISSLLPGTKKPRGKLQGKAYEAGQVVRIHRDPPPKMKYISKWRNPYEEKGDIVQVMNKDHYMVKSRKIGKTTRKHASRLVSCLFVQLV